MTLQIFLAIALISSFVVAAMASDLADRNEVHRLLTHQATHDESDRIAEPCAVRSDPRQGDADRHQTGVPSVSS